MEIRSKIWLEIDGEPVFGSGRDALLRAIDDLGSINKAAKQTHLSYRKALSYIKAMEQRIGISLVVRRAGGRNGGGAALTHSARELLKKFEKLEQGVNEILDRRFHRIFGKN
jgi:molybdate transport system regulatory protein